MLSNFIHIIIIISILDRFFLTPTTFDCSNLLISFETNESYIAFQTLVNDYHQIFGLGLLGLGFLITLTGRIIIRWASIIITATLGCLSFATLVRILRDTQPLTLSLQVKTGLGLIISGILGGMIGMINLKWSLPLIAMISSYIISNKVICIYLSSHQVWPHVIKDGLVFTLPFLFHNHTEFALLLSTYIVGGYLILLGITLFLTQTHYQCPIFTLLFTLLLASWGLWMQRVILRRSRQLFIKLFN